MLMRLQQALASWQPAQSFDIQPGTAGVASPHRLATEWAGFRLQSAGQGYYAKVLFDDQKALIDFQRSAEISRQAGELGIAPALCHADPRNGVLIFAALDDSFRWARLDALRDPHHFASLTRTLDKLHHSGLPLPYTAASRICCGYVFNWKHRVCNSQMSCNGWGNVSIWRGKHSTPCTIHPF